MFAHMHDLPATFMAHIVQYYVLLQHFRIVQERVTRDGRSRYVLLKGDRGLERTGNGTLCWHEGLRRLPGDVYEVLGQPSPSSSS